MTLLEQEQPILDARISVKSITPPDRWPRYLLFLQGRWRWRPTRTMKKHGFVMITFGRDLTDTAICEAERQNALWDVRRNEPISLLARPDVVDGGCVYVVGFGPYIKIGWSGNVGQRVGEIESGLPEPVTIHATFRGTRLIERTMHAKFSKYRLRGEWFKREGKLEAWIVAGCPFSGITWSKIERAKPDLRRKAELAP